jgi:pimeloyl-ACP methyl ester carboxylesterase
MAELSTGPAACFFSAQRRRLHYADWGNPPAPPLVLLHGGRDHCRNWDWVAARLRQNWHVIAPDLRGHGDSEWAGAGGYAMSGFIADLAELVHALGLAPVSIVAHSLGGSIATRYAGAFPDQVRRLVSIEGLGPSRKMEQERAARRIDERLRTYVAEQRQLAARAPRRYATVDDAFARMCDANRHLSQEQAMHLTRHGLRQNDDGSLSWKFDNAIRADPPYDMAREDIRYLWSRVRCPTLLVYGTESWASNPAEDGRAAHFPDATVVTIEGAGHWVHHDRLEEFLAVVVPFLEAAP